MGDDEGYPDNPEDFDPTESIDTEDALGIGRSEGGGSGARDPARVAHAMAERQQAALDATIMSEEHIPSNQEDETEEDDQGEELGDGEFSLDSAAPELYDGSVLEQSKFEDDNIRIITEVARDESLPNLVHYIEKVSKMSYIAKARLIAMATCFLSKNYVYSNISDPLDMMRVQDDYEYVRLVSRIGLSSFDRSIDFLTAGALTESQFNIRIRRSKGALNLLQVNTQRTESTQTQRTKIMQDERKVQSRIPLISSLTG